MTSLALVKTPPKEAISLPRVLVGDTSEYSEPLRELLEMLTYKRPAGCRSERKLINRYLRPLGMAQDKVGNLYKRIGDAPILWSSHTDTVHRQGGRQELLIDDDYVMSMADCLGADDTVGVWIMVQMIRRGIEGLYVFHRCEEIGGIGSSFIASDTPALLAGIKYAVAFDRYGTTSVITHQGSRCCSDEFADSLISQLGSSWERDDGGTFTDTANYTDHIGECTNISVGYYSQHTSKEALDLRHAEYLLELLCDLDVSALVSSRKPGDREARSWGAGYHRFGDHRGGGASGSYSRFDWTGPYEGTVAELWDNVPFERDSRGRDDDDGAHSGYDLPIIDDLGPMTRSADPRDTVDVLQELVRDHPDVVAGLLDEMGISPKDILLRVWGGNGR